MLMNSIAPDLIINSAFPECILFEMHKNKRKTVQSLVSSQSVIMLLLCGFDLHKSIATHVPTINIDKYLTYSCCHFYFYHPTQNVIFKHALEWDSIKLSQRNNQKNYFGLLLCTNEEINKLLCSSILYVCMFVYLAAKLNAKAEHTICSRYFIDKT